MTDGTSQQTKIEQQALKLEEYKETLAYLKDDYSQSWTILGLASTVTLALWAYTFKDAPIWSTRALVLAGLGVVVLVEGLLMARRLAAHAKSRRLRARELERDLGFELMTKYDKPHPDVRFAPSMTKTIGASAVAAIIGWFVYLALWVWMRTH
jgi:hypothetical protein